MTTLQKYLPCPFCGKQQTLQVISGQELMGEDQEFWQHSDSFGVVCDASSPDGKGGCGAMGGFKPTEDEAIEAWNTRTALAQQELPQKERTDFMAGYDAGMADAKRMAQQGEQQPVSWRDEIKVLADVYAAKVSEFARSLALAKEDDSMSPVSAAAGDARMALHEAIDTHAERIKELEAVNKLLSGIQENTEEENDTLRAQLSAIAATEPTGWQKIETAKPTGTVLLTGPRGSHLGQWGSFVRYNHPKFTHWMPLPAAPKDTP